MRGSEYADLKAFVAIVERGSFARAANALGISRSALSRVIRNMEHRLGVRLLERTTRRVSVTDHGQRLVRRTKPALEAIDTAIATAGESEDHRRQQLRIRACRAGADLILKPLLGRFRSAYSEVDIVLTIDEKPLLPAESSFDVVIGLGRSANDGPRGIGLLDGLTKLAFASPSYLDRHGTPVDPRELTSHECITWQPPGMQEATRWAFHKRGESLDIPISAALVVPEPQLMIAAARQDGGVGWWIDRALEDLFRTSELVPLFEDWAQTGLCLVAHRLTTDGLAADQFIAFLRDNLGKRAVAQLWPINSQRGPYGRCFSH